MTPDQIYQEMRSYLERRKAENNAVRTETMMLNAARKKEGLPLLKLEPKYTIESLASEMACNHNTLRRALAGNGRLAEEHIAMFCVVAKAKPVNDVKLAPVCQECGVVHHKQCRPSFEKRLEQSGLPRYEQYAILSIFQRIKRMLVTTPIK